MKEYIAKLQKAIRDLHGCESFHVYTTLVTEAFEGKIIWQNEVESFGLLAHPKAAICYAWGYEEGGTWHYTTVLSIPPVYTPRSAVKVAMLEIVSRNDGV